MSTIFTAKTLRAPNQRAGEKFNGQEAGPRKIEDSGLSVSEASAALILPKSVVMANDFLKEYRSPCKSAGKFKPKYDAAHDALEQLAKARNIEKLAKKAADLLKKNPIVELGDKTKIEKELYKFVSQKKQPITQQDITRLWNSFDRDELESHLETSQTRVDGKSIALLASAVNKSLATLNFNLVVDLKAELVGSMIAAVYDYKSRMNWSDFPVGLVNRTMELPMHLADWVRDIDAYDDDEKGHPDRNPLLEQYNRIRQKKQKRQREQTLCDQGETDAAGVPVVNDHSCECKCEECCVEPDPCCGELTYYIADLLDLREETTCYKASDLAYIENVAPGESRIRKHDFRKTIEVYSEEEKKESRSEQRDHQVTERFSLQKEMQKQVSQKLDVDASIKYDAKAYSATLNTSLGLSKDVTNREAREKFREMVTKATESIQTESRSLTSRRVTTETGESNKHKFQNTTALPFVAKYFHVSQEKRGQVFSFGKRLMLDLLIPSPAALYRKLEEKKAQAGKPTAPKKPVFLDAETNKTRPLKISDITREQYFPFIEEYGLEGVEAPPKQPPVKYDTINGAKEGESPSVTIPEGYSATHIKHKGGRFVRTNGAIFGKLQIGFGGATVGFRSDGSTPDANISPPERESGTANIYDKNSAKNNYIDVVITLTPDPVDITEWQLKMYSAIMASYKEEHQEYQDSLAEWEARQEDKLASRHPFAAEELMRSFVKKSAIWMMCDHFNDDDVMEMLTPNCGYPEINRPAATEATNRWHFFDRGFDWGLAEIKFYDFFRNPECAWPETFDPDESNFMFKAFLRAGYCRIQVPAAEGMGEDVAHYLEWGQPWGVTGERPSGENDERYKSVVQELKHQYKCYQEDRTGCLMYDPARIGAPNEVILDLSSDLNWIDPYWDDLGNDLDTIEIELDENREIFIEGIAYRLVSITPKLASGNDWGVGDPQPAYYVFQLNRAFEGQSYYVPTDPASGVKCYTHAIGAEYVGDPFFFELPTDLVWIGHQHSNCLPCYPVDCVDGPMIGQIGAGVSTNDGGSSETVSSDTGSSGTGSSASSEGNDSDPSDGTGGGSSCADKVEKSSDCFSGKMSDGRTRKPEECNCH